MSASLDPIGLVSNFTVFDDTSNHLAFHDYPDKPTFELLYNIRVPAPAKKGKGRRQVWTEPGQDGKRWLGTNWTHTYATSKDTTFRSTPKRLMVIASSTPRFRRRKVRLGWWKRSRRRRRRSEIRRQDTISTYLSHSPGVQVSQEQA